MNVNGVGTYRFGLTVKNFEGIIDDTTIEELMQDKTRISEQRNQAQNNKPEYVTEKDRAEANKTIVDAQELQTQAQTALAAASMSLSSALNSLSSANSAVSSAASALTAAQSKTKEIEQDGVKVTVKDESAIAEAQAAYNAALAQQAQAQAEVAAAEAELAQAEALQMEAAASLDALANEESDQNIEDADEQIVTEYEEKILQYTQALEQIDAQIEMIQAQLAQEKQIAQQNQENPTQNGTLDTEYQNQENKNTFIPTYEKSEDGSIIKTNSDGTKTRIETEMVDGRLVTIETKLDKNGKPIAQPTTKDFQNEAQNQANAANSQEQCDGSEAKDPIIFYAEGAQGNIKKIDADGNPTDEEYNIPANANFTLFKDDEDAGADGAGKIDNLEELAGYDANSITALKEAAVDGQVSWAELSANGYKLTAQTQDGEWVTVSIEEYCNAIGIDINNPEAMNAIAFSMEDDKFQTEVQTNTEYTGIDTNDNDGVKIFQTFESDEQLINTYIGSQTNARNTNGGSGSAADLDADLEFYQSNIDAYNNNGRYTFGEETDGHLTVTVGTETAGYPWSYAVQLLGMSISGDVSDDNSAEYLVAKDLLNMANEDLELERDIIPGTTIKLPTRADIEAYKAELSKDASANQAKIEALNTWLNKVSNNNPNALQANDAVPTEGEQALSVDQSLNYGQPGGNWEIDYIDNSIKFNQNDATEDSSYTIEYSGHLEDNGNGIIEGEDTAGRHFEIIIGGSEENPTYEIKYTEEGENDKKVILTDDGPIQEEYEQDTNGNQVTKVSKTDEPETILKTIVEETSDNSTTITEYEGDYTSNTEARPTRSVEITNDENGQTVTEVTHQYNDDGTEVKKEIITNPDGTTSTTITHEDGSVTRIDSNGNETYQPAGSNEAFEVVSDEDLNDVINSIVNMSDDEKSTFLNSMLNYENIGGKKYTPEQQAKILAEFMSQTSDENTTSLQMLLVNDETDNLDEAAKIINYALNNDVILDNNDGNMLTYLVTMIEARGCADLLNSIFGNTDYPKKAGELYNKLLSAGATLDDYMTKLAEQGKLSEKPHLDQAYFFANAVETTPPGTDESLYATPITDDEGNITGFEYRNAKGEVAGKITKSGNQISFDGHDMNDKYQLQGIEYLVTLYKSAKDTDDTRMIGWIANYLGANESDDETIESCMLDLIDKSLGDGGIGHQQQDAYRFYIAKIYGNNEDIDTDKLYDGRNKTFENSDGTQTDVSTAIDTFNSLSQTTQNTLIEIAQNNPEQLIEPRLPANSVRKILEFIRKVRDGEIEATTVPATRSSTYASRGGTSAPSASRSSTGSSGQDVTVYRGD